MEVSQKKGLTKFGGKFTPAFGHHRYACFFLGPVQYTKYVRYPACFCAFLLNPHRCLDSRSCHSMTQARSRFPYSATRCLQRRQRRRFARYLHPMTQNPREWVYNPLGMGNISYLSYLSFETEFHRHTLTNSKTTLYMATHSTSDNSENAPSKTSGQYHSAKGTVVEAVGNLTGAQSWQQSGQQEHAVRFFSVELALEEC